MTVQITTTRMGRGMLGVLVLGALAIPATAPAAKPRTRPAALPAFNSCGALLGYAHRNARRTGGGTGVPLRAGVVVPQVLDAPVAVQALGDTAGAPTAAPVPAASKSQAGTATPTFSTTNVQEAGVDEPDIVKTDGKTVFAISGGMLRALDVTGDTPTLVGSLALDGGGQELFIRGDRALVMSTSYGGGGPIGFAAKDIAIGSSKVVLTEVDISNPAALTVRRSMTLDGALVDGRMTGGTARVVVGSSPGFVAPAAIGRSAVRHWVPRTTLRSRLSGRTFRRSVVACDEVRHPRSFSGLDLLTVLTIDLDKGLFNVDRDAIMAGAQTVYGSTTGLYVASQRYYPAAEDGRSLPPAPRTEIHRFDASKTGETTYASSGDVAGFVLNQFSLSEFDGALRVASTDEPQWFNGVQTGDSQSYVSVLAEQGSRMNALGRVDGLGKGERIYAVRFDGDKGYVVTFKQIDPLFTLDLSDKANPRVLGELKLQGFSSYLHPISDSLLLGVGQDASAQGRTLGTQLSLFDVSDLRNPKRLAVASLGGNSSSDAEFDPHAFLYWKPSDLAVIPLQTFGALKNPGDSGTTFSGAVGFRIGAASLAEAGRITHPDPNPSPGSIAPPIGRSLVIGDRLYTLSYGGLAANRLDTLAPLAFAAFPQDPAPQPVPLPAGKPVP